MKHVTMECVRISFDWVIFPLKFIFVHQLSSVIFWCITNANGSVDASDSRGIGSVDFYKEVLQSENDSELTEKLVTES